MTDRELLEFAAKAHGGISSDGVGGFYDMERGAAWNSLTGDGDALRLAVKLDIDFYTGADEKGPEAWAGYYLPGRENKKHTCVSMVEDPYAATRRAITRAAAEIGKAMK